MPFNGSGAYSPPAASFPAVASTLIESAKFNSVVNDIATAISTCITKDGQTIVTANIPFGGFKLTGVGAATARTDAATLAGIQDGTGVYVATVGGTANAITLTPSPAITSYVAGQKFWFIPASSNTGATTVAVSGLTAPNLFSGGAACVGGEVVANVPCAISYDGTQFNLDSSPFQDNRPLVVGSADRTKKVRLEVDGLTTGTTRVLTIQDADQVLVGRDTTDTLTSKTITSPTINGLPVTSSWLVAKRKTAAETVTSSTTLQDDDHLTFSIGASEEWVADLSLSVHGAGNLASTGIKVAITTPSGATQEINAIFVGGIANTTFALETTSSGSALDFTTTDVGASGGGHITMRVWVLNSTNAGTVTLQFAQSTSSVSALTLAKGSYLVARRIA